VLSKLARVAPKAVARIFMEAGGVGRIVSLTLALYLKCSSNPAKKPARSVEIRICAEWLRLKVAGARTW